MSANIGLEYLPPIQPQKNACPQGLATMRLIC